MRTVLALGVVLALLAVGCGSGGKLGAKALSQQAKSVQSEASEGALLAEDAVAGKSTSIFVREHSSYISAAASKVAASLKGAETEPALRQELRRLRALATHVSSALERLGGASSKAEQRALGRQLEAAAEASGKIGEELA